MSIVIEPRTGAYDDVIEDAIRSFPAANDRPIKQQYSPAPNTAYLFGAYDIIMIFSDPTFIKVILGIATAVAVGPGKKISELLAEDLYKWFKDKLFKRACQTFPKKRTSTSGININLRSVDESLYWVLDIKYNQRRRKAFNETIMTTHFRVFENMIRPFVNHLARDRELTQVMIDGGIGPDIDRPYWTISAVSSRESEPESFILIATPNGSILWDNLSKRNSTVVKEVFKISPPFLPDKPAGVFHWRNCEQMAADNVPARKRLISSRKGLVDYNDGIKKGLRPCSFCIG